MMSKIMKEVEKLQGERQTDLRLKSILTSMIIEMERQQKILNEIDEVLNTVDDEDKGDEYFCDSL